MIVLHGTAGITVLAAGMLFTIMPVLIHTGLIRSKRKRGEGACRVSPKFMCYCPFPVQLQTEGSLQQPDSLFSWLRYWQ